MLGDRFDDVLRRAALGEEVAFADLYRDVHPPLLRYLRTLAWEHAEDAASETWLELARGLTTFSGSEGQFRSFVFTVARRKLIDRVRWEARRPTAAWEPGVEDGPTEPDVADRVLEDDATYRALALVRTLPPDQAEAVILRVVAGLEYADVAEVMERSPAAVRVLVHRGLRRLETRLSQRTRGVTP